VLVRILASCDQASTNIEVLFAVGSKDWPAGMTGATLRELVLNSHHVATRVVKAV
jgi:hypothetical protein